MSDQINVQELMTEARRNLVQEIVSCVLMEQPEDGDVHHIEVFTNGESLPVVVAVAQRLVNHYGTDHEVTYAPSAHSVIGEVLSKNSNHTTVEISEKPPLTVNRRFHKFCTIGKTTVLLEQ